MYDPGGDKRRKKWAKWAGSAREQEGGEERGEHQPRPLNRPGIGARVGARPQMGARPGMPQGRPMPRPGGMQAMGGAPQGRPQMGARPMPQMGGGMPQMGARPMGMGGPGTMPMARPGMGSPMGTARPAGMGMQGAMPTGVSQPPPPESIPPQLWAQLWPWIQAILRKMTQQPMRPGGM
jgi:hypothetical protein